MHTRVNNGNQMITYYPLKRYSSFFTPCAVRCKLGYLSVELGERKKPKNNLKCETIFQAQRLSFAKNHLRVSVAGDYFGSISVYEFFSMIKVSVPEYVPLLRKIYNVSNNVNNFKCIKLRKTVIGQYVLTTRLLLKKNTYTRRAEGELKSSIEF